MSNLEIAQLCQLFKTHKTIISFRVVFIYCNFCANNFSKLLKWIKKFLIVYLFSFWEFDENISIVKISSFHYFSIEWQSSTRFSFDFKISHFVARYFKLFLILNSHNCSIKIVWNFLSIYLRLNIKSESCLFFKSIKNFDWCSNFFW